MKFYAGVTDNEWFHFLAARKNEDINFWQPSGRTAFKVLEEGAPFIFKLKNPANAIGGVGFFSSHSILPLDVAWDIFEERNGLKSYLQFRNKIIAYRRDGKNSYANNPNVGCIVLTDPIFFKQTDWIPTPPDWKNAIVQGKSYFTETEIGADLWSSVEQRISYYRALENADESRSKDFTNQLILEPEGQKYGKPQLVKSRLGQGAFRVQITDAYSRRCAISGEKTLPALEAAHVKPYAESGPHHITNGLLLRADMHKLYDSGYLTITTDFKVEVSNKIKEEFNNGKDYYKHHGQNLLILPDNPLKRPNSDYIEWHNQNIYNG
jgi:putative restriction endonuclease